MVKVIPVFALALICFFSANVVYADDEASSSSTTTTTKETSQWYNFHIQGTSTTQGHPSFSSAIPDGPESMKSHEQTATANDVTLFTGLRIGALELYADPEMDQGFGLSDTVGVAGYVNGESGKVGMQNPYFRLPRMFGRYVVGLGGYSQPVEDGPNQLAGSYGADNVTFTFGKFSIVDIFDNNSYAHDPQADFLNWSIIDMGAFDYAADAWGYTYGGAAEWINHGGLYAPDFSICHANLTVNILCVVLANINRSWKLRNGIRS